MELIIIVYWETQRDESLRKPRDGLCKDSSICASLSKHIRALGPNGYRMRSTVYLDVYVGYVAPVGALAPDTAPPFQRAVLGPV